MIVRKTTEFYFQLRIFVAAIFKWDTNKNVSLRQHVDYIIKLFGLIQHKTMYVIDVS